MWRHHVIHKARHSTPSTTEFEKQVHKVELSLFFNSIISDCFLLNDPAALVHCWRHVSINVFINVSHLSNFSPIQFNLRNSRVEFWHAFSPSLCRPLHEVWMWGLWGLGVRTDHALLVYWSSDASRGSFQNISLVFSESLRRNGIPMERRWIKPSWISWH